MRGLKPRGCITVIAGEGGRTSYGVCGLKHVRLIRFPCVNSRTSCGVRGLKFVCTRLQCITALVAPLRGRRLKP